MNKTIFVISAIFLMVSEAQAGWIGQASFYHHPRYNGLIAAHRTLPFGTHLQVTNLGNGRSVTVQINGRTVSAEYSDQTGQLLLREDGAIVQEWYPPHSWVAIASAAGASNWGTRPSSEDLQALIRNEMLPAAQRVGYR